MKEWIYQMNIHNVDELRQRLMIDVAMSGNVGKTHVYVMVARRCNEALFNSSCRNTFVALPSALLVFFNRATRIHSADYAACGKMFGRPSVCHTPVLCLNDYTYPQFFSPSGIAPPF